MLFDIFQQYNIPTSVTEDDTNTADPIHSIQHRYLGKSSIKLGSYLFPFCTFYEVIASDSSDASNQKIYNSMEVSSPDDDHSSVLPESTPSSLDGLAAFALNSNHVKVLPPKKRKRRRVVQSDIIFTLEKEAYQISPKHIYYCFPRDAMTECLTESAPHRVLFSFYPKSSGISHFSPCDCHSYSFPVLEEGLYRTKLEEFAAVCSTSYRLAIPDQSKTDGKPVSLIMSNVSVELFRALKLMVSSYEVMCQNMMDLMKLHTNRVIHHKSEVALLPETVITHPNQSDEDYQTCRHEDEWSSGDEQSSWDKAYREEDESSYDEKTTKPSKLPSSKITNRANNSQNQMKKCLYCGSKSTPMWRRGPQGAGTLCNACGVKWKHGKILNGNDTNNGIIGSSMLDQRKLDKKRKRSSSTSKNNNKKSSIKKRESIQSDVYYEPSLFTVPPPREIGNPPQWEGQSTSSSTTDSGSPLESFSCSPNTSPSLATLMEQHDIKGDITALIPFDSDTLSVYVGEDAVEAAAVLTLLKRS
ncbi:hypothetical protein BDB01DRAFT_816510 [Pilobolus umbonatus]|nr:hypothetical protein BDB01DRAFT_816510 [Pilobolus umbonatus]